MIPQDLSHALRRLLFGYDTINFPLRKAEIVPEYQLYPLPSRHDFFE